MLSKHSIRARLRPHFESYLPAHEHMISTSLGFLQIPKLDALVSADYHYHYFNPKKTWRKELEKIINEHQTES